MSTPPPGAPFDALDALRFSIGELQHLAARLSMTLEIEQDDTALVWDMQTSSAVELLERTYRDIGDLARFWCEVQLQRKRDLG